MENPLGIDELRPRLSWWVNDGRRGARQTAYQIIAIRSGQETLAAPLWDSGKVRSEQSVHVPYGGPKLRSRDRILWKVRSWDVHGHPSAWSDMERWEMGLLDRREWKGEWIGSSLVGGPHTGAPCPFLRKPFVLRQRITSARLYGTALGLYECSLNGRRVGDAVFTPGWTDYGVRVQYQTYDVTGLLRAGKNVIGAILGDGWYCGNVAAHGRQVYGDRPRLLVQLEVYFADGSSEVIVSDDSWKWHGGPILESDMLMGESYDARREMRGWNENGFNDANWSPVRVFDDPSIQLVAQKSRPVRSCEELRPVKEPSVVPGNRQPWIFDLGQNMVGRVRLKIRSRACTTIRLRYAEMLQADGTLYTANLGGARATDYYTFRGNDVEIYEPRFTFHGFRYVELSNCAHRPDREAVTGIVLHSDMPTTGEFECSNALVNQLQNNIRWGQKGNFLEVPTDCPQRDERLGWTGDAQVFIRTAAFNMEVAAFFTKWQQDLADAQAANGLFPKVAPDVHEQKKGDGGPAWADAGIICPWTIHLCCGDTRLLERSYESFVRFVQCLERTSRNFIRTFEGYNGFQGFGDWLAIDAVTPGSAPTPKSLIGTAYFARCAELLAKTADILGRKTEAQRWKKLSVKVNAAFNREFVSPGGRVVGNTQTGYLLALAFDLLPEDKRSTAIEHLIQDIRNRGWHLSTGFVGAHLLAPVLSRFGHTEVAYRLVLQETYPSWLYTVRQGATTMWERWNSWTTEGGFGPVEMNSFNHYAYGAIGEWLYATVGGIDLDPEQPGYKHILIHPQPGGDLTHAKARHESPYGPIETEWHLKKKEFTLSVRIPANTWATVFLPSASATAVTEGGRVLRRVNGISNIRLQGGCIVCDAGAGSYQFCVPRDRIFYGKNHQHQENCPPAQ